MTRAFIIRPFGAKAGVNFDTVDEKLIQPALAQIGVSGNTTTEIVEQGNIREARIALGGIATRPWRAREAERVLVGRRPETTAYRAAADAALAGAVPRAHNAFKIELAKRTLIRALTRVGAMA